MTHIVIKHPPRTPDRRATALIRLQAVLAAINSLLRDGYIVESIHIDAQSARPVVCIMPEPRLARMVERDQAVYYMRGRDNDGKFRVGQFNRLGVTVIWRERADWGKA